MKRASNTSLSHVADMKGEEQRIIGQRPKDSTSNMEAPSRVKIQKKRSKTAQSNIKTQQSNSDKFTAQRSMSESRECILYIDLHFAVELLSLRSAINVYDLDASELLGTRCSFKVSKPSCLGDEWKVLQLEDYKAFISGSGTSGTK